MSFPFMLPEWTEEKVGGSYVMVSPRVVAEYRRAETETDPGRGVNRVTLPQCLVSGDA